MLRGTSIPFQSSFPFLLLGPGMTRDDQLQAQRRTELQRTLKQHDTGNLCPWMTTGSRAALLTWSALLREANSEPRVVTWGRMTALSFKPLCCWVSLLQQPSLSLQLTRPSPFLCEYLEWLYKWPVTIGENCIEVGSSQIWNSCLQLPPKSSSAVWRPFHGWNRLLMLRLSLYVTDSISFWLFLPAGDTTTVFTKARVCVCCVVSF